jgi:hypothetical protein
MTNQTADLAKALDRELIEAMDAMERLAILSTAFFRTDKISDNWERADKFRMLIELLRSCQANYETDASDEVAKDYRMLHESMFYGFYRATSSVCSSLRNYTV